MELIPRFMLPAPIDVFKALVRESHLLYENSLTTLTEAFLGLVISIILGFILSYIMDASNLIYKTVYPLLVISQTVPVIAIAPLLVLWFGYGIAPKIVLIVLVCFFPITIGLLNGYRTINPDTNKLLQSMGASSWQTFRHLKLQASLPTFFAGLKIAVSYSIVGAVIAEWLGGSNGLGVYMTRVRKSYSFDKMFAVIILISLISIVLIWLVSIVEKKTQPYRYIKE